MGRSPTVAREASLFPYAFAEPDDLAALLPVSGMGERSYRSSADGSGLTSRFPAAQVAGQALWAAAQTAGEQCASALHLRLIHPLRADEPVEYAVEPWIGAHGRRCCRVYATQGLDVVGRAHVRFSVPGDFENQASFPPECEWLPAGLAPGSALTELARLDSTGLPFMDLRAAAPVAGAFQAGPRRAWCRLRHALPLEGPWCAAALACIAAGSAPALIALTGLRQDALTGERAQRTDRFFIAFHCASFDVNDWLRFDTDVVARSPTRYEVLSKIYSAAGVHLASSTQTYGAP